ncbi:24786_t:CDS:2 [Entrophospora sp. SA101]|nr:24786_t:CDS:2 [Entrophospora sp. SA101]
MSKEFQNKTRTFTYMNLESNANGISSTVFHELNAMAFHQQTQIN